MHQPGSKSTGMVFITSFMLSSLYALDYSAQPFSTILFILFFIQQSIYLIYDYNNHQFHRNLRFES